jgi:hypothetical protein
VESGLDCGGVSCRRTWQPQLAPVRSRPRPAMSSRGGRPGAAREPRVHDSDLLPRPGVISEHATWRLLCPQFVRGPVESCMLGLMMNDASLQILPSHS